jgi:hypothetical protein
VVARWQHYCFGGLYLAAVGAAFDVGIGLVWLTPKAAAPLCVRLPLLVMHINEGHTLPQSTNDVCCLILVL